MSKIPELEDKNNGMMRGVAVLSIASFLTKALSAFYKVPFQNLTGDAGFYVYQQVYPLYGIAVALALNGLPLFISKIVSETDDKASQNKVLKQIGMWLSAGALILFICLWGGAGWIAQWMGDSDLRPVIRSVSYIYLFVPFLALIRGFFQGRLNMVPTAVSQIGEQVVRVIILLVVAYWYTRSTWSVYEMGALAIQSSWIAGLTGASILSTYLWKNKNISLSKPVEWPGFSLSIGKRIVSEGLTITAMTSLMVLFQLVDAFTVYNGLIVSGLTEEVAMSMKGIYDRGQPFVQLGMVVGLGFSTTLLPLLKRYDQEKKFEQWQESAASVLKLTVLFSGAATAGLIAVMPWMNEALFSDRSGTDLLRIYVLSIFIASLISCCHSVLQSHRGGFMPIVGLGLGLLFKLMMNQFAVQYVGTMGSAYITVVSLIIVLSILMINMPREVWSSIVKSSLLFKAMVSFMILVLIVNGSLKALEGMFSVEGRLGFLFLVLFGVALGGVVFFGLLLKLNLLTKKEQNSLGISNYVKKVG